MQQIGPTATWKEDHQGTSRPYSRFVECAGVLRLRQVDHLSRLLILNLMGMGNFLFELIQSNQTLYKLHMSMDWLRWALKRRIVPEHQCQSRCIEAVASESTHDHISDT